MRPTLLELVGVAETSVLPYVLLSLSRVGTVEDLKAIRTAAARLSGNASEQARFAQLLLAHRLGIGLDVVPPVPTSPASHFPARTTAVTLGSPQEAMRAWSRFVANASLGFELDSRRCSLIYCARRMILFIPSIQLANRQDLLTNRAVVGATAAQDRETASWHHDLWILSTPTSGGVELQAWTQGGRACYTGTAHVVGEGFDFELRTVDSSGLALAHVRGRLTKDGLTLDGTVGDRDASDSRTPGVQATCAMRRVPREQAIAKSIGNQWERARALAAAI